MNAVRDTVTNGLFGWDIIGRGAPSVEVLGVPSDVGNGYLAGARGGPRAIREASRRFDAPCPGVDAGDLDLFSGRDWSGLIDEIREAVAGILDRGALPVLLGGDHAISYGSVAACAERGPLDVVWFDAHTDFCAWQGGDWHNHKQVLRRIATLPEVRRIVQIGHRGITYKDETLLSPKMTVFGAEDAAGDIAEAMLASLSHDLPVYLSVDIDAIDPVRAPGTGHPVPGGLTPERVADLVDTLRRSRHLVALDLTEVNPLLDHGYQTAHVAAWLLRRMLTPSPD